MNIESFRGLQASNVQHICFHRKDAEHAEFIKLLSPAARKELSLTELAEDAEFCLACSVNSPKYFSVIFAGSSAAGEK
jgi:hypothetical protein